MNNSGPGSNYEDPHSHSFATESAATPVVKKPNPIIKVVILGVGVVLLGLSGLVLWGFVNKKPAAPAPAPKVAMPAPKKEEPAAPVVDPAQPPVADPNLAMAPAVDPNAPVAVDPNQAPVLDANGNPIVAAAPTDPNAPAVVDPNAPQNPANPGAPLPAATVPAAATPAPNPVPAPTTASAPAAPVVAPPVTVAQDPANGSVTEVVDSARQEMTGVLDRLEKRLVDMEARFNSRFDRLEKRMDGYEARTPGSTVAAVSSSSPTTSHKAKRVVRKPVARKVAARKPAPVHRSTRSSSSENRLEIVSGGSLAPVSHAVIVEDQAPSNRIQVMDAPVARPVSTCRIQSIKPGRVWIRRADGSFATYGVGDALPGGRIADSIDPDTGIMAGGRAWSCN